MERLSHLLQDWHHVSLQPVLLALTVAVLLSAMFLPHKTARALKDIPGPYSYPVLGNLGGLHFRGLHNFLLDSLLKYGPVFKYKVGRVALLSVADPEIVQQVGVRMFKVFHDRMMPGNFNVGFYDKGLVFGKGKYWVGLRNSVVPLFHSAKLRNFGKTMHACAGRLVQRLEKAAKGAEQVNLLEWAAQMTLDTLGTSAFGVTFNNQAEEETEGLTLVKAMNGILASVARPSFSGVLALLVPSLGAFVRLLLAQVPGTADFAAQERTTYLFRESQKIIEARRKDVGTAERHDFLSMLMQARDKTTGEPLSDEVIGGLVSEFIRVGTDTTATTIAFAVYNLANNPTAEEKMCREIQAFFQRTEKERATDGGSRPSYDELSQFPYVEKVIQETLRMYPTILNTIREANEDCHVAGVNLSKGAIVAMPVYAMHRNPAIFLNPDEFQPERFDPEEVAKRHPYSYIPFGVGPRMCIGQRFAMEEAKLALIRLYERLTFTVVKEKVLLPNGEFDLQAGNALKPRNGLWVVPKLRSVVN